MKPVPVRDLPVGSYIDSPVYLDQNFILLAPEIPIAESLIRRLAIWEFNKVYTEGGVLSAPPSEAGATVQSGGALSADLKEEESRKETFVIFKKKVGELATIFERFKTRDELRIAEITDLVKELIDLVKNRPRHALSLPDVETPDQGFLVSHAVKTSILGLAIADFLKLPPHRVIEVGIAGLLHTIGMLRIPSDIYLSDRPLNEKEKQMIVAQPILGFRSLKAAGFAMPICLAVLEHHERIDGSGYPRNVTGEKLSMYGKIIAVASSYVAAVSQRPFREARDGHSGIMDLLRDMGKLYDEKVLRALVFTLSIYPIGTYVELASGSRGIVIRTNPETPKMPIVKLLTNPKGEPYLERPVVQSEDAGDLQVSRPLTAEESKALREIS
ncbi:MAG TPA: HD domain-containing phosphohydrolase [Spirochaetia bacterium]|nr:HD domain-containing phosphohydrolase [Spirochaetia bacterium]